jgi:hypothetical protein
VLSVGQRRHFHTARARTRYVLSAPGASFEVHGGAERSDRHVSCSPEQLLYQQGFQNGMLGQQIVDLEARIAAKTAPKWAMELDTEYLSVIKDLGNGAIHRNGGDITKQAALDVSLVSAVETVFAALLLHVYELAHVKEQQLGALRRAKAALKK